MTVLFRTTLVLIGGLPRRMRGGENDPKPKRRILPVYTILVPLYREANDRARRLSALCQNWTYPQDRLDIKLHR